MLKTRRIAGAALACAAATLAIAPAAQPQSAAKPEPCGSYLIKDAQGDQAYKQQGQTVFPAPANADVVGVFFRVIDGKVTANLAIDDLNTTLPQGFTGIRYRVYATVNDEIRYFEALLTSSGVSYTYGHQPQLPEIGGIVYSESGDTTGAIFEGKNGVVQIVMPPDAGGTPGTKLNATSGSIGLLSIAGTPAETQLPPIYFGVDTAPDGAADGPGTTPKACDPPATGGGDTGGGSTGGGSTGGGDTGGGSTGGGSTEAQNSQELKLTLAKSVLSARKVKKAPRLTLRSSEELTGVTVRLKRGSRTLGTKKLAKVGSSTPLRFKLKKPLKKGSHKLAVSGRRADGSAFATTLALRVKK